MRHRKDIEREAIEGGIETKYQYQHRVDKKKKEIQHEEDEKRLRTLVDALNELTEKRLKINKELYEEYNDLVFRTDNYRRRSIQETLRGED